MTHLHTTTANTYRVEKAKQHQGPLLSNGTYCTLRPDVADDLGSQIGQQLRIEPVDQAGRTAVFTVHDEHNADANAEIRIAKNGRQRLGIDPSSDVLISRTVPRQYQTRMDAFEQNTIAETVWDRPEQDTLLVCAPHGGDIESNTAQAAGIVRKRVGPAHASAYMLHGFGEEAFSRFHVTTTEMAPKSYPGLATLADRGFTHCLTFHVWNGDEILIGGLADPELREQLADYVYDRIDGKREIATDHSQGKYMAQTESNLVNRLTGDGASGVQIEMPPVIAHHYRKRVARAVADCFDDALPDESRTSRTQPNP